MTESRSGRLKGFLRRQLWVVAQCALLIGAVVAFASSRRDGITFSASAVVQVEGTSLTDAAANRESVFNDQVLALYTPEIRTAAASAAGVTPAQIADDVRVAASSVTGSIVITATGDDAGRVVAEVNALTDAFLADRAALQPAALLSEVGRLSDERDQLERDQKAKSAELAALSSDADPTRAGVLQDEIASSRAQLDEIGRRIVALEAQAEHPQPQVDKVSDATMAIEHVPPKPLSQALLGATLGACIGLAVALIREHLDDTVRSPADVERAAGRPIMTEIPFERASALSRRNKVMSLACLDRPHGAQAESVRHLRTYMGFMALDSDVRCVMVTSPANGEGKTLVASNLAVAFAQAGKTTILVAADVNRPSPNVHGIPSSALGLTDLIISSGKDSSVPTRGIAFARNHPVTVRDVLRPTVLPQLTCVGEGARTQSTVDLLRSAGTRRALRQLRSRCDVLVIDGPSISTPEGQILSELSDAVVLVAALDQSSALAITDATRVLNDHGVPMLGVVLNKVHQPKHNVMSYPPAGTDAALQPPALRGEVAPASTPAKPAATAAVIDLRDHPKAPIPTQWPAPTAASRSDVSQPSRLVDDPSTR